MKDLFEKFNIARKTINIHPDRKQFLRSELETFVKNHPVSPKPGRFSLLLFATKMLKSPAYTVVFAAVLLIFVFTGTNFAAANAQPGDVLYGVRLGVIEPVRAALIFDTEAKANYEAHLTQLRLEEAKKVSASSQANADLETRIAINFQKHVQRTQKLIAKLEAAGKTKAATELSNRLTARLEKQEDKDKKDEKNNRNIIESKIDAALHAGLDANVRLNDKNDNVRRSKADTEGAASGKITAASNVISATERLINRDDGDAAEAKLQLQAAKDLLVQAQVKLAAEDYNEAFRLASKALRTALDVKISVNQKVESQIDRGSTPSVNSNANLNLNVNANQSSGSGSGSGKLDMPGF